MSDINRALEEKISEICRKYGGEEKLNIQINGKKFLDYKVRDISYGCNLRDTLQCLALPKIGHGNIDLIIRGATTSHAIDFEEIWDLKIPMRKFDQIAPSMTEKFTKAQLKDKPSERVAEFKEGDTVTDGYGYFYRLIKKPIDSKVWDYKEINSDGSETGNLKSEFPEANFKKVVLGQAMAEVKGLNATNQLAEEQFAAFLIRHEKAPEKYMKIAFPIVHKTGGQHWSGDTSARFKERNLYTSLNLAPLKNFGEGYPNKGRLTVRVYEGIQEDFVEFEIDLDEMLSEHGRDHGRKISAVIEELKTHSTRSEEAKKKMTDKKNEMLASAGKMSRMALAKNSVREGVGNIAEGVKIRTTHKTGEVLVDGMVAMLPIPGVKEALQNPTIRVIAQGGLAFLIKGACNEGALPEKLTPFVAEGARRQLKAAGYELSGPVLDQAIPMGKLLLEQLAAAGRQLMSKEEIAEVEAQLGVRARVEVEETEAGSFEKENVAASPKKKSAAFWQDGK